jgi:hypothetical protein
VVRIFPYDTIDHPVSLGPTRFASGAFRLNVFEEASHIMAMQGRDFMGREIESISVNLDENRISVSSKYFRLKNFRYSALTVFDTENIRGLPFEESEIEKYRVFDWFNVRSGTKHDHDFLESESDFAKKIHFYLSPRIDGNKYKKDLVVESFLTKEQLYDVDYSDSLSRLKTLSMMRAAGIKGTPNGAGKNLSLKIELAKREVFPIKKFSKKQKNNVILDNRHFSEV